MFLRRPRLSPLREKNFLNGKSYSATIKSSAMPLPPGLLLFVFLSLRAPSSPLPVDVGFIFIEMELNWSRFSNFCFDSINLLVTAMISGSVWRSYSARDCHFWLVLKSIRFWSHFHVGAIEENCSFFSFILESSISLPRTDYVDALECHNSLSASP